MASALRAKNMLWETDYSFRSRTMCLDLSFMLCKTLLWFLLIHERLLRIFRVLVTKPR